MWDGLFSLFFYLFRLLFIIILHNLLNIAAFDPCFESAGHFVYGFVDGDFDRDALFSRLTQF